MANSKTTMIELRKLADQWDSEILALTALNSLFVAAGVTEEIEVRNLAYLLEPIVNRQEKLLSFLRDLVDGAD